MWKFDSKADLEVFIDCTTNAVISVYLDDGFNPETLRSVHGAKAGFDAAVEDRWHMLLPHENGGLTVDFHGYDGYDFGLARKLAAEFQVDSTELPVIVFADPNSKGSGFVASISNMTPNELAQYLREVAEITNRGRERTQSEKQIVSEQLAEIRAMTADKRLMKALPALGMVASGVARIFA